MHYSVVANEGLAPNLWNVKQAEVLRGPHVHPRIGVNEECKNHCKSTALRQSSRNLMHCWIATSWQHTCQKSGSSLGPVPIHTMVSIATLWSWNKVGYAWSNDNSKNGHKWPMEKMTRHTRVAGANGVPAPALVTPPSFTVKP